MTPEEQKIWDTVHEWCNQQAFEIPDFNRRQLMERIAAEQSKAFSAILKQIKDGDNECRHTQTLYLDDQRLVRCGQCKEIVTPG